MSRYVQFPSLSASLAAGARDRAVRIEALTQTTDESGFPIETWSTLADRVWMHKEDLAGGERLAAMQVTGMMDSAWAMDWREDMDPEALDVLKSRRLVHNDRVFDIVAASVVGRRDGIELMTLSSDRPQAMAIAAAHGIPGARA